MPHRCHFILQGHEGHSALLNAAKGFRHEAGYWLSRIHCEAQWSERSLGDILRIREQIAKHARYILNRPVRMGLVDDWKQYRFKGSKVCHLDSWCDELI
jgi:phage-related protein